MRTTKIAALAFATVLGASTLMSGTEAKSDSTTTSGGTASVYGNNIPPDQIEFLSTPERIISVTSSGSPSAIWEALEHGEDIECLNCISAVEPLIYDSNAQVREISAWWLRRRTFGVFGPGEVYERTVTAVKSDPSPQRRAYAAYALGEFLTLAGVTPLADAVNTDSSPIVRAAAVSALGRLNDEGAGAVSKALSDGDTSVKLAAVTAASRINSFNDVPTSAKLLGDSSAQVRRRGVELLEGLRSTDSVQTLIALARNDQDADVRLAACHALGLLGDSSARTTLEAIAQSDANGLVRDQALIALRRM